MPGVAGSRSTVLTSIVPSTSESFVVMFIQTGVSSSVATASFTATGVSLTAVTVINIVPILEVLPSLSLTV